VHQWTCSTTSNTGKAPAIGSRWLGYHVTVCGPRPAFATEVRFPESDEVVVDWPHRFLEKLPDPLGPLDAVCVLTHEHKFDVPALLAALDTHVGYLGAMGSGPHAGGDGGVHLRRDHRGARRGDGPLAPGLIRADPPGGIVSRSVRLL